MRTIGPVSVCILRDGRDISVTKAALLAAQTCPYDRLESPGEPEEKSLFVHVMQFHNNNILKGPSSTNSVRGAPAKTQVFKSRDNSLSLEDCLPKVEYNAY